MAKLVFCEDDPTIQKLILVALRSAGRVVHMAPNGREGLLLIEQVLPDVVFSDSPCQIWTECNCVLRSRAVPTYHTFQ